ncbi:RNA 2',3'-cyclic phosphodiesterase, partial [bacterium]|nr:RNA 2',3'-cyclic phosphodiesterase [bacterium]
RTAARDSVRWVAAANIHLTLKFLGDADAVKLKPLTESVASEVAAFAQFKFSVRGTGVFPGWRSPRILWAGIEGAEDLNALQSRVDFATRELGFPSESRPFSPHLTLGRVNGWMSPGQLEYLQSKMAEAKDKLFGTVAARQVTIFQSVLKPSGAVYTTAATCNLGSPVL